MVLLYLKKIIHNPLFTYKIENWEWFWWIAPVLYGKNRFFVENIVITKKTWVIKYVSQTLLIKSLAMTMPEVHKFFETQCNGGVWQLLKQVKRTPVGRSNCWYRRQENLLRRFSYRWLRGVIRRATSRWYAPFVGAWVSHPYQRLASGRSCCHRNVRAKDHAKFRSSIHAIRIQ